jgi:hypothetical protein
VGGRGDFGGFLPGIDLKKGRFQWYIPGPLMRPCGVEAEHGKKQLQILRFAQDDNSWAKGTFWGPVNLLGADIAICKSWAGM